MQRVGQKDLPRLLPACRLVSAEVAYMGDKNWIVLAPPKRRRRRHVFFGAPSPGFPNSPEKATWISPPVTNRQEGAFDVGLSCWAIAVLTSTIIACILVFTAYQWYARNPIITVIESTQGAIWDIPFPAVTVCNLNIISKRAARALISNVTLPANMTADNMFAVLRLVPMLHFTSKISPQQLQQLRSLQTVLDLNNLSVEMLFRNLSSAASCNDLLERCMWKNTLYRCDLLFQQVFTYFSLCCTFNYFGVESSKMVREAFQAEMPRRVASCGYQTALTILVNPNVEDYYSAAIASQGTLVFIDNAYNVPDIDSPVRLVNPSTEVLIALSPERTYSTPGVKWFTPEERQCYYNDEVKLGTLRQYSFHNCVVYQRIEIVQTVCGCIPYYFPVKDFYRTCNFNDIDCLQSLIGVHVNVQSEFTNRCLPECEHYSYPLEVALGKLAKNVRLEGQTFFRNINLENRSVINVFFNDLVSTRYRRDVYLNWQNLLASFGGLLSLLLGFTLIAGFDLIIFFFFGVVYSSDICFNKDKAKNERLDNNISMGSKGNKIYVQEFRSNFAGKAAKHGKW
ncbi:sodium channel protein Nach-like [Hyposmocoma kahamanoa]|uniref:sodium channel protein Nach-like n=1 Tax=Hyposmocoma kahamanoa TaxID=1477025 RepID=UPI000E6D8711|nr:sodium channel protein Nach-like [Hyposmocoma kahamanoa]